jgi:hypothetical protein
LPQTSFLGARLEAEEEVGFEMLAVEGLSEGWLPCSQQPFEVAGVVVT